MNQFLDRVTTWELPGKTLNFGPVPKIMGIVNVTPDSFSDGGRFLSCQAAVDHALRMEDDGADLVDIGGESTRPYSVSVSLDEELRRVVPVIEKLQSRLSIPISVDTSKAQVAAAAMGVGAQVINDVTGLEGDAAMLEVAKTTSAAVCVMHMQGTPQTMQDSPEYKNVVEEIYEYLAMRDSWLIEAGVSPERICLDPGIGFGKTHEHNLELLRHASFFLKLKRPILVGHSRKGFIAKLLGDKSLDRMAGTLGVSLAMAVAGVQLLRVHDVKETCQAFKLFEASGGLHRLFASG